MDRKEKKLRHLIREEVRNLLFEEDKVYPSVDQFADEKGLWDGYSVYQEGDEVIVHSDGTDYIMKRVGPESENKVKHVRTE